MHECAQKMQPEGQIEQTLIRLLNWEWSGLGLHCLFRPKDENVRIDQEFLIWAFLKLILWYIQSYFLCW